VEQSLVDVYYKYQHTLAC